MKNSQLNRVLSLIKTTNDRVVIMDQATDDVVVLLTLTEYEKIALKKVATDPWDSDCWPLASDAMAGWAEHDEESSDNDEGEDAWSPSGRALDPDDDISFDDEQDYALPNDFFPESELSTVTKKDFSSGPKLDFNDDWVSPEIKPSSTEESLADIPSEDTDPPFYLEPVE